MKEEIRCINICQTTVSITGQLKYCQFNTEASQLENLKKKVFTELRSCKCSKFLHVLLVH